MRKSFLFVVLVVMSTTVVHGQVPASEREALTALYNSTGGASWTNNSSWLLAAGTECSWFGVTCSGGHVEQLVLPSNQLDGVLPIQLANLQIKTNCIADTYTYEFMAVDSEDTESNELILHFVLVEPAP